MANGPSHQQALTNSYTTSPNPTPIGVPPISALKVTVLNPSQPPSICIVCIPGPTVTARSVPEVAPELADAAPMPNI